MPARKGYAEGPDGQVHFVDCRPGIERVSRADRDAVVPLLLLHQTPCHLGQFDAATPFLGAAGLRTIAVDTPGYGQSDPPPGPPTIAGYAGAVLAVLDYLGLAVADVLGHHTGAATAAELAVMAPGRIRRVILNGPPLFTPDERRDYLAAIAAAHTPRTAPDGSHLQHYWERRVRFTPGWTSVAAMHRGVVMMLQAEPRERDGYTAAFAHDVGVPIAAIRQPTLILTNTGDDLYAAACRAHRLRPDLSFHALDGGTHDIVDEQPEAWAAAVAAFVSGGPGGGTEYATPSSAVRPPPSERPASSTGRRLRYSATWGESRGKVALSCLSGAPRRAQGLS